MPRVDIDSTLHAQRILPAGAESKSNHGRQRVATADLPIAQESFHGPTTRTQNYSNDSNHGRQRVDTADLPTAQESFRGPVTRTQNYTDDSNHGRDRVATADLVTADVVNTSRDRLDSLLDEAVISSTNVAAISVSEDADRSGENDYSRRERVDSTPGDSAVEGEVVHPRVNEDYLATNDATGLHSGAEVDQPREEGVDLGRNDVGSTIVGEADVTRDGAVDSRSGDARDEAGNPLSESANSNAGDENLVDPRQSARIGEVEPDPGEVSGA